jgi:hypothetical protein
MFHSHLQKGEGSEEDHAIPQARNSAQRELQQGAEAGEGVWIQMRDNPRQE